MNENSSWVPWVVGFALGWLVVELFSNEIDNDPDHYQVVYKKTGKPVRRS